MQESREEGRDSPRGAANPRGLGAEPGEMAHWRMKARAPSEGKRPAGSKQTCRSLRSGPFPHYREAEALPRSSHHGVGEGAAPPARLEPPGQEEEAVRLGAEPEVPTIQPGCHGHRDKEQGPGGAPAADGPQGNPDLPGTCLMGTPGRRPHREGCRSGSTQLPGQQERLPLSATRRSLTCLGLHSSIHLSLILEARRFHGGHVRQRRAKEAGATPQADLLQARPPLTQPPTASGKASSSR